MAKTALDKKNLPTDLDTIKALIDEREAIITAEQAKRKKIYDETAAVIDEAETEVKILRVKAADILGIPTRLRVKEGVTPKIGEIPHGESLPVETPGEPPVDNPGGKPPAQK